MIKEIVNLGEVVNHLASVFTMHVDDTRFVKVDIDKNEIDIYKDSVLDYEEFLDYGLFRERISNKIILFPISFVMEIDKKGIKTKIDFFENGLKYIDNKFLNKLYEIIKNNFEEIKEEALEIAGEIKTLKRIAVCIFYENNPAFLVDKNLLNALKDFKISIYFKDYQEGLCNILGIKDKLYYPKANFYYPFSTDKKIVKFDLKDDKNLFLMSKQAILNFFAGKEYLEKYNRYRVLGILTYLTVSTIEQNNLEYFEEIIKKDEEKSFNSLISAISISSAKFKQNILINFYFHTSPAQGSKEIISYIKDVMPTFLVKLDKEYKIKKEIFKDIFNFEPKYWSDILYFLYNEEKLKREMLNIFSKIVLNKQITIKEILKRINLKNEEEVHKLKSLYQNVLSRYLFLVWLQQGEIMQEIKGNDYKERLYYILNNFELIKNSNSAKVGVCMGLIIKMISFSINDFDKKVLSFVSKKLGRDKKSLLKFINPIFEKAKLHQKSQKVSINIDCVTEIIAIMDSFDKEEFIFGMFLGNEIYNKLKGAEDE